MALRLIFMGTPEFSVPSLLALAGQGHEIAAVYTQPPRPAGRGMDERKSPVHEAADQLGITVCTPKSLKGEAEQAELRAFGADAAIVIAYGLLLPQAVLDGLPLGCWNAHASLLPRWRGAAPIQRAIMAGDRQTGVCIMRMEAGLDTGPVAMIERIAIADTMTAGELHDALAAISADLVIRAAGALERGTLETTPQPEEGVTYARKIDKAESRIDWSRPAGRIHDHVRGLSPFPGAWTQIDVGGRKVRLKVLRSQLAEGSAAAGTVLDDQLTIACGEGALRLLKVQREGKGAQDTAEFLRGNRVDAGTVLS